MLEAPLAEVAVVLARRTAAVESRDKAVFMSDIDTTDADFKKSQERLFDNFKKLPFASAVWEQNGEFVYKTVSQDSSYGAPTYIPAVRFSYEFKGFDLEPIETALALTFVKRGDRWLIAADDDKDRLLGSEAPQPWDVSRIAVAKTKHALVIGSTKDAKRLRTVAAQTEEAIRRVDRMWSKTDLRSVVVYVPRDRVSLDAYFPPSRKEGIVFGGLEFPVYDVLTGWFEEPEPESIDEAGNRVIINTREVPLGSSYLPTLLRHEVTHVATSRWTQAGAPVWLIEGAAEYTAYREDPYRRGYPPSVFKAAARGELLERLPTNDEFYGLRTGYDKSYLLVWYLKRTYGESTIIALYRETGAIDDEDDTTKKARKAISEVLGVSEKRLLKDFNTWAERVVRRG